MSIGKKILIGALLTFVLFGVGCASMLVGTYNDLARQEQVVLTQYQQNQNNYDNYFKKLKETAQVPEMYATDLKKVYDSAMTARYGKDGSKAVFQFLKEQNPQLDPSMYIQIQRVIESGRNNFEANQKMLLDKKNNYETNLRTFPTNIIAGMFGYPTDKMKEIKIITSEETEQAFKTGKTAPIKLR